MKKFLIVIMLLATTLAYSIDDQEFIDYINSFNYKENNNENYDWAVYLKEDVITDVEYFYTTLFSDNLESFLRLDISNGEILLTFFRVNVEKDFYNYVYRFDKDEPYYNGISKEPIYKINFDFEFFQRLCLSKKLAIRTFDKNGIILNTYVFNTDGLIDILKQYDIKNILE